MDDREWFLQQWRGQIAAWPVQRVLVCRETGPVPAGAKVRPDLRINLVTRGQHRLHVGRGGRSHRYEVGCDCAFLGLPQTWDRAERKRYDCAFLGIICADDALHFLARDFLRFDARRSQLPDRLFRTRTMLPAAGRHIMAALRDLAPRPDDDPVLLGLVRSLVVLAVEHLASDEGMPASGSEALWRRMRFYLQEHCHQDISREAVARTFDVNPATCSVLAQRFAQRRFIDVLNGYRLSRARELLRRGGLSVAEAARRSGFTSSTYLGRLFKRRYGMTPGQWLQRAGTSRATAPQLGDDQS